METLWRANDIPDSLCAPMFHPILHRGDIRRGIPIAAVRFPYNKWILTQGLIPDHYGAVADLRQPALLQLLNHSRQFLIIKALAQLEVKTHPEEIIDLGKFLDRKFNAPLPNPEIFVVPLLEFDQFEAT